MNYYGVNEKYEAIKAKAMQQAEDNGGVIDDYIADALELAEIEKEDAIFGLMYDIKNSGAELEKVKAVLADIQDKKKHLEASIDNKKLMLAAIAGAEAYSDGVVKTTKAVTSSLVITGHIPEKYVTIEKVEKTVEKVDKKAIKADIGEDCKWAHLEYRKSVK